MKWRNIMLELFCDEVRKTVLELFYNEVTKNYVGVVLWRGDEKLWWLCYLWVPYLYNYLISHYYFCFIHCWLVYWQIHLSLHLQPLWHCHVPVPTGLFLLWATVCVIELLPFTQWSHCREAGWPLYGDGYRLVAAGFMPGLKMDTQIHTVFQLIKT